MPACDTRYETLYYVKSLCSLNKKRDNVSLKLDADERLKQSKVRSDADGSGRGRGVVAM